MEFTDMEWSNMYFPLPLLVREGKKLGLQLQ